MDPIETSYNIGSSSYEYDLSDAFNHPLHTEVFISGVVWTIWFLTLAGNLLVFAAFVNDSELRARPCNLFILNLALADFIVGAFSLTLQNLWRMFGNWPFGEVICNIWMVLNYGATLQSTFAIVLISMDRYLLVKMELKYRTFMTHRKAWTLIFISWFCSMIFYTVPIVGYPLWAADPWEPNFDVACWSAVLHVFPYNIVAFLYGFLFPGILLIFFNMMVFLNIRKRSGGLVRSRKVAPLVVADLLKEKRLNAPLALTQTRDAEAQEEVVMQQVLREKRRALKKDRKAAAVLAMIVIAYIICWLPYCTVHLIFICHDNEYEVSILTWSAVFYVTWSNSALNPFLYAIASPKMRKTLIKVLCFWKRCQRRH